MKFDDSVLWLVVWWTAEAAGDMELLLWFSVDGDTMVGGVDDSYPELAAGDGCGPGLVDSCTFNSERERERKMFIKMLSCTRVFAPGVVFVQMHDMRNSSKQIKIPNATVLNVCKILKQS